MQNGKIQIIGKGFLKGFIKMAVVSMLFYRNMIPTFVIGSIAGVMGIRQEKKQIRAKEQKEMTMQFRDGLQGIASALSAGYAIENAFMESRKDLMLLYGKDSLLAKEQYESANRKDIVSICKEMEHRRHFFICPDFSNGKENRW